MLAKAAFWTALAIAFMLLALVAWRERKKIKGREFPIPAPGLEHFYIMKPVAETKEARYNYERLFVKQGPPQGMTPEQFQQVSDRLRERLKQEAGRTGDFGDDIFVHGSRGRGTAGGSAAVAGDGVLSKPTGGGPWAVPPTDRRPWAYRAARISASAA